MNTARALLTLIACAFGFLFSAMALLDKPEVALACIVMACIVMAPVGVALFVLYWRLFE